MVDTAIQARALTVRKGGQIILPPLDVTIQKGAITGLIGPSGSGKTTLMRTIVGVQAYDGELTVLEQPAGARSLRPRIGYVTQSPAVYSDLTVQQNMAYFAAIVNASHAQIDKMIEVVRLKDYAMQLVGSLSGGQRARVNLAVALLGEPDLLVLDEPTVGLDPILRNELWKLFRQQAQAGTTVLVSSHVMDEAERCDNLVLLRDGAVLWNDTRARLLKHTQAGSVGEAFETMIGDAQ